MRLSMPSKANTNVGAIVIDNADSSETIDDEANCIDTSANAGTTPSVLELVPSESKYTPMTEDELEAIGTMSLSAVRDLEKRIPHTYEHVPDKVWQAVTSGRKGLSDPNHLSTIRATWGQRMEDFKSIHKESLLIIQRLFPNLYSVASDKVHLDYETVRTRFSQDGINGTGKGVDKTLVRRMYDIMVNALPQGHRIYINSVDGDDLVLTEVDALGSDTESRGQPTTERRSKRRRRQAALKTPVSTASSSSSSGKGPTTASRKTSKRPKGSNSSVGNVTPAVQQDDATPQPSATLSPPSPSFGPSVSSPTSSLDEIDKIIERQYKTAEEAKNRIDDLLAAQAKIADALCENSHELYKDAAQARSSVGNLQDFYNAAREDRETLIRNYTRVIDILYNSYLEQYLLLQTRNMWFSDHVEKDEEGIGKHLGVLGRLLHPRPECPSRNSSSLKFTDAVDVLRGVELEEPLDTLNHFRRFTKPGDHVVSALCFSNELQSELDGMGKIPPSGLINLSTLNLESSSSVAQDVKNEYESLRDPTPTIARSNKPSVLVGMYKSYQQYLEQSSDDDPVDSNSVSHSSTTNNNDIAAGSSYSHFGSATGGP